MFLVMLGIAVVFAVLAVDGLTGYGITARIFPQGGPDADA